MTTSKISGISHPLFFFFFCLCNVPVFFCYSMNNPYPFVTWDVERIANRKFDYIVVGGGAAGCPLAVTLSLNFSVLLLERGSSPFGNPDIELAENIGKPLTYADSYTSVSQRFVSDDGIQGARARVLGGGTAINGGFYSRGSREMVSGEMGLNEVLVNQSYHWIESKLVYNPGPLSAFSDALIVALLDAEVDPYHGFTLDHVEGTKTSGLIFDNLGRRHVVAELLDYANGDNLLVLLNSTVGRVLFEYGGNGSRPRAYGVEFMDRKGVPYTAVLNNGKKSEVILWAGVLGSPQLLMLSGIGPAAHLNSVGIQVVVDSPAVGKGIADPPSVNITIQPSQPLHWYPVQLAGITQNSTNYIMGSPWFAQDSSVVQGFLTQNVASPKSRGQLWLRTLDPRDNPVVRFNYYTDPVDLATCVNGVRLQSAVLKSPAMQMYGYRNLTTGEVELKFVGPSVPENVWNVTEVEDFCRNNIATSYHYHGGCLVPSVIDHLNRVNGVKGLRVVDISTLKESPGTNPQATVMMIGRYKALKMIEERSSA